MKGLHSQRPDATPDQPASPVAAARRPRLTPLGVVIVFLLMLVVGSLPSAWATPGPTNGTILTPTPEPIHFRFDPTTSNPTEGDIFTVAIRIDSATHAMVGVDSIIHFDPSYLEVVDAAGGLASTITPGETFVTEIYNSVNNATGEILYAAGADFGEPGVSGEDLLLATIRFRARVATASTALQFADITASAADGGWLPVQSADGVVSIAERAPCGPIEVTRGVISTNDTWRRACSPYVISGNVMVGTGATLTIEPGVEVRFAEGTVLQVNGTLIARGTSEHPTHNLHIEQT